MIGWNLRTTIHVNYIIPPLLHISNSLYVILCYRHSHNLRSSHHSDRLGSVPHDSARSVLANQSDTASEADTLTGVHLDNSSQFGIPPVFNARGMSYTN